LVSPAPELRLIPPWIRVLAAVLVLLIVYSAWLAVSRPGDEVRDLYQWLLLASQLALGICGAGLFGYVAATGFPPTQLFQHAGDVPFALEHREGLDPGIQRYLLRLRSRHPGIREFWHLDPPPEQTRRGWHFLALADPPAIQAIRADWDIRRRDVTLLLVDTELVAMTTAWGQTFSGRIGDLGWEWQSDDDATFRWLRASDGRADLEGPLLKARRLWHEADTATVAVPDPPRPKADA
jgi:hypothetical protein